MKRIQTTLVCLAFSLLAGINTHAAASIANESRPRLDSRAGNSVDTASGAFIQEINLAHVQGARALDLNLSYNSLVSNLRGEVGYGWSHQYEARVVGNPDSVVTVYLNGNIGNQYRFAEVGKPYTPLNEQNRFDVLERFDSGGFRLIRSSGTAYYFADTPTGGAFRLEAVLDKNSHPVTVVRTDGERTVVAEPVSSRILRLHYRFTGVPLLHFVGTGNEGSFQPESTFLQYDERDRLSRIYGPVKMEPLFFSDTISAVIQEGSTGLFFNFNITVKETDRLFSINTFIRHSKPETLQAFLISPSKRVIPIDVRDGTCFMDQFLGENPAGFWNVHVIDTVNDGVVGSLRGILMNRSTQAANWTQYDYEPFPSRRISKATDSKGQRIYSNTYDSQGRVVFQDDGRDDNGGWRFTYEPQADGDLLTTVYDRTPFAYPTRYRHDGNFHLRRIEDALGHVTGFTFDPPTGVRLSITDTRGNTTRFAYTANGFLSSVTQPGNVVTRYGYDEYPLQLLAGGEGNGGPRGNLTSVTDALNYQSRFAYDEFNNLITSTNALQIEQSKVYDTNGMLIITVNKGGNGLEYGYTDGMITSANLAGDDKKEKLEYDASGRVIKLTGTDGAESYIVYDSRGNIVEKRNQLGHKILSQFDHRNRQVSETDPEGNVTRIEYDGNGNAIRVTNPLQEVTRFEYDGEDRLVRVTDPASNTTQTAYDAIGQVTKRTDELGNTTSYQYDEGGNQTAVFNDSGVKLSGIAYNALNVPVTLTDARGKTTVFEYDKLGQRISQTDALGKVTKYDFDPLGRVAQVTDPLGRHFRKSFLSDDVLDKISDAANKETSFGYTDRNQVTTIRTPGNNVTTITYTDTGHVASYSPPSLKAQQYTYNLSGRLERTKHLGAPVVPDTVYAYDRRGNVTSIGTQSGTSPAVTQIARSYDALGRQVSNTDASNNTIRHTYNSAGLVSQITYPDSKTVQYTYDAAKQLKTITDWMGRVTEYAWNANRQITSIRFPNQTTRVMKYDATGLLLSRADLDARGATLVSYAYTYDANGFITTEQLQTEPVVYEPPVSDFTYDNDNRLIQKNGVAITYDKDGNVTQGPVSGQSVSLGWDQNNNLQKVGTSVFRYDVEDHLIGWQVGADSVEFATVVSGQGSQILVSKSSTGATTRYVYGVGLAYEETNGEIKVHHYDERGNTVTLSNSSGQVSGMIAYSPFGEVISRTGDTATLFQYGGLFGVITAPNGLNNMRFRWYSPEMKRFISMDSSLGDILLPGSLNRYSYANNNPINFNDPDGEFVNVIVGATIGATIGAVVGVTLELVGSAIQGKPVTWEGVAAAAIGGAIAGGISAACPACGVYAKVGLGAFAGGLGSASETLFGNLFRKERVNGLEVAVSAGIGFAAGGVGAGLASLAEKKGTAYLLAKAISKNNAGKAVSAAASPGARLVGRRLAAEPLALAQVFRASRIGGRIGSLVGSAVDLGFSDLGIGALIPNPAEDGSMPPGNAGINIDAAVNLPTANVQQGGEYAHFQSNLGALQAADRPLPDSANRLSSF